MDANTTLIAPITKIPSEILAEIFLYACPGSNDIPFKKCSSRRQLTRVCREWQAVALGQALLWNDVTLDMQYDLFTAENPKILKRANMWLSLSKDSPITIRIIHNHAANPNISGHAMSGFIFPYAKRIVHLEIHTGVPTLLQSLFHLPAGSFPSLRRLIVMVVPRSIDASLLPGEAYAFRDAHNLRSVDVRLPRSLTDLSVPSSQLHELSLRGVGETPVQFIIDNLKPCVHLHSLALDPSDEESGPPTTATYPEMPCLKRLELRGGVLHDGQCRSVPLTAPNLEELAVYSAYWSGGVLSSFVMRSGCKIRRLRVIEASHTFFGGFLGHIPYVEELDLGVEMLTSSAMQGISLGTLLPALRSLKCTTRHGMFQEFLNMLVLRARMQGTNPPSRIEDIDIVLVSFQVTKSLAMEWLESQGIRIRAVSTSASSRKKKRRNAFNDELYFVPPL